MITSQPSMQFNSTNMFSSQSSMISNLQDNFLRIRRREQRAERQRQEAAAQRRQLHQRRQQQYEHWQQRLLQRQHEQAHEELERERGFYNDRWGYADMFEVSVDQILQEQLLDAYNQEKIDSKSRWDQEQLNELEGFVVLEQLVSIQD